jgi:hypothetical protein
VKDILNDLVDGEPAYVLRPDEAIAAGRRRRRRRALLTTGTTGAVVLGTMGAFALLASPSKPTTTVTFAGQPTAAATSDSGDLDNVYYRVARKHTPAGWTMTKVTLDGDGIWADVQDDQGNGPGRFGLYVSKGGLQQHPCSDAEFVAKAVSCTETALDADTRLVIRSTSRTNSINDVQVGIIHANGYGVYASDDNAVWPDPPIRSGAITPAEKLALNKGTIGSPEPVYDLDDLVAMVKELDALQG